MKAQAQASEGRVVAIVVCGREIAAPARQDLPVLA